VESEKGQPTEAETRMVVTGAKVKQGVVWGVVGQRIQISLRQEE
jgi:hypothetical protein